MRIRGWTAAAILILIGDSAAWAADSGHLQIYFIDVAGGQSTLIVTPAREALLIDAGWAGKGERDSRPGDPAIARDPGRIVAAMRDAGVDRIDYLLVTHFHRDHIGGIPELARLVPIGAFIDNGSAYPAEDRARPDYLDLLDVQAYDDYLPVRARARHIEPRPGDLLPLKGVRMRVVSSNRSTLRSPLPSSTGRNTACPAIPIASYPGDENLRSIGVLLEFGRFRFLDVGDLNAGPLFDLVCPWDRIGPVDLYLAAHHGGSGAAEPATLAAFRPRAVVVNNSPRKGGRAAMLKMLNAETGLDSWQLHVSAEAEGDNAPSGRIANLDPATAYGLKLIARKDGSFSITNARTGVTKSYPPR